MPSPDHATAPEAVAKDLLRLITCGSVDDGKSTLIGRLLYDSQQILEDQLAAVADDSKKYGTTPGEPDLALLVDGLKAEREQGITIDVAFRYFSTARRKFIIADTPGHEQYTRNMATGASTAAVAVILVDVQKGLQIQTRRHSYIAHLMGIRKFILAVNKMDRVHYDARAYAVVRDEYAAFVAQLGIESMHALPLSALTGDNVVHRSQRMGWYDGPSLMELLESLPIDSNPTGPLRFPVQYVNRCNSDFRGYCGTVASGVIRAGDRVLALPSARTSTVERIVTAQGDLDFAETGRAVTLTLRDEIDLGRGELLADPDQKPRVTDAFDARIVWMAEQPLLPGRQYDLRLATLSLPVTPETIHHRINVNTLAHEMTDSLALNEIGYCRFRATRPLPFDSYERIRATGSFVLIDRISNATLAAGMIVRPVTDLLVDKSSNVVWHETRIDKRQRSTQKAQRAAVLWFTGLSGAGKSSIANALEQALFNRGYHSYLLDGDNVRHGLNRDLGFSDLDRVENIRRIGEVARLMADAGLVVLSAFISPFRADRAMVRALMEDGEFIEIHVDASLETCEARDPKGLYQKARAGIIRNFTGIDSPYEPPQSPEVVLDTERLSIEECVDVLLDYLKVRGILIQ